MVEEVWKWWACDIYALPLPQEVVQVVELEVVQVVLVQRQALAVRQ